jgi:hypothetical protein
VQNLDRARQDFAFVTGGWAGGFSRVPPETNHFPLGLSGELASGRHVSIKLRSSLTPRARWLPGWCFPRPHLRRDHPVQTFREDQQVNAGAGFAAAHEPRPITDDQSGTLHGFILS